MKMQLRMLERMARIFYRSYDKEKPTAYLINRKYIGMRSEDYSFKEVENNVALICSICMQILS